MSKYIYWNNKATWHGAKLFEICATCILEADTAFEASIGFHPQTAAWVGCQVFVI